VAHKALAAGAIGLNCAKLGEAEVLAAEGVTDILVANQVVGPRKIERLAALRGRADVKVAVDDPHNVREIGRAAAARGLRIGVVVEVDIGMSRAGVAPGEAAVELSRLIASTAGLTYQGLMGWEGHAVGLQDPAQKLQAVHQAVGLLGRLPSSAVPLASRCRSSAGAAAATADRRRTGDSHRGAGGQGHLLRRHLPGQRGKHRPRCSCAAWWQPPAPDRLIFDAGFRPYRPGRAPLPVGC
jgi:D-serine deaminase-like pyridoxal phosphate-dependent protein